MRKSVLDLPVKSLVQEMSFAGLALSTLFLGFLLQQMSATRLHHLDLSRSGDSESFFSR